jgi:hypothetical protein
LNHYFFGIDVGFDAAIRTDGEVVIVQLDAAFDFPIKVQVFASRELSPDHDGLPNVGNVIAVLFTRHGTNLQEFLVSPTLHAGRPE